VKTVELARTDGAVVHVVDGATLTKIPCTLWGVREFVRNWFCVAELWG
jgi:hypothetical protein